MSKKPKGSSLDKIEADEDLPGLIFTFIKEEVSWNLSYLVIPLFLTLLLLHF